MRKKLGVWKIISNFIYHKLGDPNIVVDPAAGDCEFINQVQGSEKWAVDMGDHTAKAANQDVKVVIGNNLEVNLPENYFEGIFVSNFLDSPNIFLMILYN